MSDKPILYYVMVSPPCRAVLLCAAELGIDLELREASPLSGDLMKDDYLEVWSIYIFCCCCSFDYGIIIYLVYVS